MWPKHPASVVIDSATYLLTISSPDIDNAAMSLYDVTSTDVWLCNSVMLLTLAVVLAYTYML